MKQICRFTFPPGINRSGIEGQLAQAIISAECLFGQARARLDAAYVMSSDGRRLVLDVSNEVGEYIARLFTGLLIRELGEEGFSVERTQGEPVDA